MSYQRYTLHPDRDGGDEMGFYIADSLADFPRPANGTPAMGYTKDSGLLFVYENGHWESKAGFEKNLRRLLELILLEQHSIRNLLERGA